MREFLENIFKDVPSDTEMGLFSFGHIFWFIFIIVMPILLFLIFRKTSEKTRLTVTQILVYLIPIIYFIDLAAQFVYEGNVQEDKPPFHICTLLGVIAPAIYFDKRFNSIRDVFVSLSFMASLIFIVYPGNYLDKQIAPYSFRIVQTFLFHGLLVVLSVWMIINREVKFNWKNFWKSIIGIILIACWAEFGNVLLDGNFFFIRDNFETMFGITFLPSWSFLPIMFTLLCAFQFVFYLVVDKIDKKRGYV